MRRVQPLPVVGVSLLLVFQAAGGHAFEIFNDSNLETEALKIWRITNDRTIRHHSNYHNIDPFSPDGRYVIYTIHYPEGSTSQGRRRRPPATFAVFDLHIRKEVFHPEGPALRPIWARKKNTVYWIKEGRRSPDRALCRLDLSGTKTPRCDDLTARRVPRGVETVTFDDRYLLGAGPKEWTDREKSRQWVIWQVEPDSLQESTLVYQHPAFPGHITYEPRAHPSRPLAFVRQARLESTPTGPRRTVGRPARFLLDLDGRYLGAILPDYVKGAHVCWSGDGRFLVRGDGPLRGRESPFVEPGDWKILSTELASDPSPCGVSGQWLMGIGGINGRIFVADSQTGYTRLICYPASIIHQPKEDKRDLSGPYDSDSHGSPDGTKIYFSTNYGLNEYPVTRTTSRIRRSKSETGPAVLEVESTAGFPESGALSVWCTLVKYKSKEPTRFLGCRWGYGSTRFPPSIRPGVVVTDYDGRCVKHDSKAPLAHQAATDVYIAVVRGPDPPTLVLEGEGIILHPGYNHRETSEYHLYLDGRLLTKLPARGYAKPVVLAEGGALAARAVEWSRLESPDSNAVTVKAGSAVILADESVGQPPLPEPESIKRNGRVVGQQYLSPDGWPCQVLEYRVGGTLHRRKLFRARDRIFSVEEYDPSGRRIKETLYNREQRVSEWTRFENGTAVERWHLRYGLFPVHKKLLGGRWVGAGR